MSFNVSMNFGPKDAAEEKVFAEESFLVDVQVAIHELMESQGVTQKELAKRLELSEARVSQMLSGESNLTVRNLARIYHALGATPLITAGPIPKEQRCAGGYYYQECVAIDFSLDELAVPTGVGVSPDELEEFTVYARVLKGGPKPYAATTSKVKARASATEKAA